MYCSAPSSPIKTRNPIIGNLVERMSQTQRAATANHWKKIEQDRKIHHSQSLSTSRRIQFNLRPKFNNKCKEGSLMDKEVRSIPYMFISAHKNQTFILPDRAFAKGKQAKRFYIKMKDSSIYSFREKEQETVRTAINKDQKDRTIVSRQVQQYNRIVDTNDGKIKAANNRWFLKNRKTFTPTNTIDVFSQCQPMLEPKDPQARTVKKISLAKTFDYKNRWRPVTRGSQAFSASFSSSLYSDKHYPASVV